MDECLESAELSAFRSGNDIRNCQRLPSRRPSGPSLTLGCSVGHFDHPIHPPAATASSSTRLFGWGTRQVPVQETTHLSLHLVQLETEHVLSDHAPTHSRPHLIAVIRSVLEQPFV